MRDIWKLLNTLLLSLSVHKQDTYKNIQLQSLLFPLTALKRRQLINEHSAIEQIQNLDVPP
jgi:hypothetical protein